MKDLITQERTARLFTRLTAALERYGVQALAQHAQTPDGEQCVFCTFAAGTRSQLVESVLANVLQAYPAMDTRTGDHGQTVYRFSFEPTHGYTRQPC